MRIIVNYISNIFIVLSVVSGMVGIMAIENAPGLLKKFLYAIFFIKKTAEPPFGSFHRFHFPLIPPGSVPR